MFETPYPCRTNRPTGAVPPALRGRQLGAILLAVASVLPGFEAMDASAAEPDATDRSMAFVEKSAEATELFNQRRWPEAMVLFEDLFRNCADLDEDGFVGLSLGDCLNALGRTAEARASYQTVAANHPELHAAVQYRLRDIGLAGEPDDALLEDLRQAAATSDDNQYAAQVQLGRALQKRAAALLREAMATFRAAADSQPQFMRSTRQAASHQADVLTEIQEDLASLIDRTERVWGAMKSLGETMQCDSADDAGTIKSYRAEWTSGVKDQPVRVEMSWDSTQSGGKVIVNSKAVSLAPTQALIIRRHQERIDAILKEAMGLAESQK